MKTGAAYLASIAACLAVTVASPALAEETQWTKRVTTSAMGGHVLGNPLAKHKLVEYMSYVCGLCASFERQSYKALHNNFIPRGNISFEVRNLVLNRVDFTAALLARCGGRTKFFGNHRAILLQQSAWLNKFDSVSPAAKQSTKEGPIDDRLKKIARLAGLYDLMARRGYSVQQVNACLTDKDEQQKILTMADHAMNNLKFNSTPSFTLDGKPVTGVRDWSSLSPYLTPLRP